MRTYHAPEIVLCEIGLKRGTKFSVTLFSPQSSYVSRMKDRVRRGFFSKKLEGCRSVAGGGRPPRRPPSTSAILMPSFLLNVLLLFQLPSLLPVTVVSVRPEKSKAAEFSPSIESKISVSGIRCHRGGREGKRSCLLSHGFLPSEIRKMERAQCLS